MYITVPTVIPSNANNYRNIDQNSYLNYNFTVLYTSINQSTTTQTLVNVSIVNNAFVVNQKNGSQQWIMIGAKAVSVEPYYYTK